MATTGGAIVAETPLGDLAGEQVDDETLLFKGIRYALPPLGERRFAPPEPLHRSQQLQADGIQPQLTEGVTCAQTGNDARQAHRPPMSEDCLVVNVWRPRDLAEPAPVMVWIHGGAWIEGVALDPWYQGGALTQSGVILVSVDYRLGAFGFLHTGDPRRAGGGSAGVLDQQAALGWVRQNIASFGGDPGNVTVFGQSAGGASVETLLSLPSVQELFQRAIVQSGPSAIITRDEARAEDTTQRLRMAGVETVDELVGLDTDAVLAAQQRLQEVSYVPDLLFGPVVDGETLDRFPLAAIADGVGCDVPVVVGTTRDEAAQFFVANPALAGLDPGMVAIDLVPWVGESLGGPDATRQRLSRLAENHPGASTGELTIRSTTEMFFHLPAERLAEARHQGRARCDAPAETYMYRFDWPSGLAGRGAVHSIEVPFVFGTIQDEAAVRNLLGPDAPASLARTMGKAWTTFARNGAPRADDLPAWPPYDLERRPTMIFDVEAAVEPDPSAADRRLFDDIPYDGVTPAPRWAGTGSSPQPRFTSARPDQVEAVSQGASGLTATPLRRALVPMRNCSAWSKRSEAGPAGGYTPSVALSHDGVVTFGSLNATGIARLPLPEPLRQPTGR